MAEPDCPTTFFSKTYDEAFALLVEARNYVAFEEAGDRAGLNFFQRLIVSCETSRLTARITHIMSWLLFQKAIFVGEIGRDAVWHDRYRLSGHEVCLGAIEPDHGALSPRLSNLMDRSRRLYVRVSRLDEMMARA